MESLLDAIAAQGIRRPKCERLAHKLGLESVEDIPRLHPDCLELVPRKYRMVIIELYNAHIDLYTTQWHPLLLLD